MSAPFQALLMVGTATTAATYNTLQYFENFPAKEAAGVIAYSNGTMSIQEVNFPLQVAFKTPVMLLTQSSTQVRTFTILLGLYTMNGGTLSLMNSASGSPTFVNAYSYVSLATSATQNITPGQYYLAMNILSAGNSSGSFFGASSINPGNAFPGFFKARMTVSTNAMPTSLATSGLDVTGSDVTRQPYIIISA
jgi:hypothetical protein